MEAEQRAAWAERNRAEEARRQVAEERLRIARDVHDIVGHSLATITLQAGVAEHCSRSGPSRRAPPWRRSAASARSRWPSCRACSGRCARATTRRACRRPGLDALPRLVADMRAAGLAVELERDGDAAPVPELIAVAAFRIARRR